MTIGNELANLIERLNGGCVQCGESDNGAIELFDIDAAETLMAEAAAELSRLSALVAWQDIETAPKDGDELLFCLPRQQGVRLLARWDRIYRVWRKKGEAIYFHPGDLWVRLPAPPVSQLKDTTNADK